MFLFRSTQVLHLTYPIVLQLTPLICTALGPQADLHKRSVHLTVVSL